MKAGRVWSTAALLCALGLAACKSPTASTPATVTLAPGQSATVVGSTVTFVGVVSDSRCPVDVTCIQAGDAVATFLLSARGLDGRLELAVADQTRRTGSVRGVTIEFKELDPKPRAATPIDPASYRATVEVRN